MKTYIKFTFLCLLAFIKVDFAQFKTDSLDNKFVIGFGVNAGTYTYYGELNNKKLPFTTNNKLNYGGSILMKYKRLGIDLNYNTLNYGQELNQDTLHKNFITKGNLFGIGVNLFPVLKKQFGWYVGAVINYGIFKLYTDTLDANGNVYKYWSDGTIRNVDENYTNSLTATKTKRDRIYESELGNKSSLLYGLKTGIIFRAVKDVNININLSYMMAAKESLEAFKSNKANSLLHFSAGLHWYFNRNKDVDNNQYYKDVDFDKIYDVDSDGDGVYDKDDVCQGTEKNIKVDSKGCPLDDDNDGITDVKDKEKNTNKKKLVDLEGKGQEPGTGITEESEEELKQIELDKLKGVDNNVPNNN